MRYRLLGIVAAALAAVVAVWAVLREPSAAPASRVLATYGGFGHEPGRFHRPRSVASDGATFWVLDVTDRVQAFDVASGGFLRMWHLPDILNGRPQRIALAPDGTLFVADTHYGRILRYDREGRLLGAFGGEGTGEGQLHYPVGLAFREGEILVSEYGGHDRIQRFDATGRPLGVIGMNGMGPGEFLRPQGLAVAADGLLYVADAANHRVQVFDRKGAFVRAFGEAGTETGRLSYPYDVAIDAKGRVVVTEYGAHRVSLWTPEGAWLAECGGLANPWAACPLPDGTILVTDSERHRVERWRLP